MNDLFAALAGYGRGRLERQDRRIAEDQRAFENKQREEAMALQKRQYDEARRQFEVRQDAMMQQWSEQAEMLRLERDDRKEEGYRNWLQEERKIDILSEQAMAQIDQSYANIDLAYSSDERNWLLAEDGMATSRAQRSLMRKQAMAQQIANDAETAAAPFALRLKELAVQAQEAVIDQQAKMFGPMLRQAVAKAEITEEDAKRAVALTPVAIAIGQQTGLVSAWADVSMKLAQTEGIETEAAYRRVLTQLLPEKTQAEIAALAASTWNSYQQGARVAAETALIQGTTEVPKQLSWIAKKFGNDTGALRSAIMEASATKRSIEAEAAKLMGGSLPGLEGMTQERTSLSNEEWGILLKGGEVVDENGKKRRVEPNPLAKSLLNDAQLAEQTMTELTQYLSYLGGTVGETTFPGTLSSQVFPDRPEQRAPASSAAKPSGQRRSVGTQGAGPIPFGFNQGQGPMVPFLNEPPDWLKSRIPGFPQ